MNRKLNTMVIFDFDKTLVKKDSFRLFSLIASNNPWRKIMVLAFAVCSKFGIIGNSYYKKRVLWTVWKNRDKEEMEGIIKELHKTLDSIRNFGVWNCLIKHLKLGDKVVVVSGSPLFYLEPYLKSWSEEIEVFGSAFRQNGRSASFENVYGAEKVLSVSGIMKSVKAEEIILYTDHISDMPLIKMVDKVYVVKPSRRFIAKLNDLKVRYEII